MKETRVIITDETENTPELRLRVYKECLRRMLNRQAEYGKCINGFCYNMYQSLFIKIAEKLWSQFDFYSKDNVFVELMAYCPKDENTSYWFPMGDEDIVESTNKRISILKEIIAEMEK